MIDIPEFTLAGRGMKFWMEAKEILEHRCNLDITFAYKAKRRNEMDEIKLQDRLIDEFFDERQFGDPHDYAARAEILALRERIAELEGKPLGKAQKGGTAKVADKAE